MPELSLPAGTTSHTITGLTPGTEYTISVRMRDAAGNESGLVTITQATAEEDTPDPAVYPLDVYTDALSAYSLRKLRSDYTGYAIRVRRDADSADLDVGFDNNGDLDATSIEEHSQGGDVSVIRIYNQVAGKTAYFGIYGSPFPLICEGGSVLRHPRTNRPYWRGRSATGEWRESEDAAADYPLAHTPMVALRFRNRTITDSVPLFGASLSTDNHLLNSPRVFSLRPDGLIDYGRTTSDTPIKTRFTWEWGWVGARIADGTQSFMVGPSGDGSAAISFGTDWGRKRLRAHAGPDIDGCEYVFWDSTLSPADYRSRLWLLDAYWDMAPNETAYNAARGLLRCHLWWQGKFIEHLASKAASDYTLETTVGAVNAATGTVSVSGADWSHLPVGHQVGIGSATFLLSSAPSWDGQKTTLFLAGDLSAVTVGQPVVFRPFWDGTYSTVDELAQMWVNFMPDGDGNRDFELNGRALPNWYVLDDGSGKGVLATGAVRIPDVYESPYVKAMGREPGWWPTISIPHASGKNGNPFYGSQALGLRALAVDMINLIMLPGAAANYTWSQYHGGYVLSASDTLHHTSSLLDADTSAAFKDALMHYVERADQAPFSGNNANQEGRTVAAMGTVAAHFADGSEEDTRCFEAMKRVMFWDRDGEPDTHEGTWHKEGTYYEGREPEGSYSNRYLAHVTDTYAHTYGRTRWQTLLEQLFGIAMYFQRHHIMTESAGTTSTDGTGWSARTKDAILGGQWTPWAELLVALATENGHWKLRDWRSAGGVVVPDEAGLITATQSYINALTTMTQLGSTPPIWQAYSSWTPDLPVRMPSGWYAALRAIAAAQGQDTLPLLHASSTEANYFRGLPAGAEDWTLFKGGSGTARFGGVVHHHRKAGAYGGSDAITLHGLWFQDYGTLLATIRTDYDTVATAKTWPICGVWGYDDRTAPAYVDFPHTASDAVLPVTFDASGKWVEQVSYLSKGESGTGLTTGASWRQTQRIRVLDATADGQDGVAITLQLDYTPPASGVADKYTEINFRLPLISYQVGKQTLSKFLVQYWTGSSWSSLTAGSAAAAQEWRVVRSLNGGADKTVWLRFAAPVTISRPSAPSTLSDRVYQYLDVNLHPTGDKTAQDIPALINMSMTITATDPGFVSTAIGSSFLYPSPSDVLMSGPNGIWAIRTLHDIPVGESITNLHYEYELAAAPGTWTNIASITGGTGTITGTTTTRSYVGKHSEVPTGISKLRVRTINSLGSESITEMAMASAALVRRRYDQFAVGADATINTSYTGYTENTLGAGYAVVDGSNQAKAATGMVTQTVDGSDGALGNGSVVTIGTKDAFLRAVVNIGATNPQGDDYSVGLTARHRDYYRGCSCSLKKTYAQLYFRGSGAAVRASFGGSILNNTDYIIELLVQGNAMFGRLLNMDGTQRGGIGVLWNLDSGVDTYLRAGFALPRSGQTLDDLEIYTK